MKADYLSYQSAANRSLLGLAIQLALGLLLLIFGLFNRDSAAVTGSTFVLLGVPVWLTLAILFDQHRRERIEAIEAEAFAASDAASSSVFEQGGDELRVAARRLKMVYRFVVPVISLAIGAVLIGIGIVRFNVARARLADYVPPTGSRGWAIAIGLTLAFVGFLFARYVSGMAKQKAWANLRAGAGFAVGTALIGLTIAIGHFVDIAGPDAVLRYLPIAFAAALVIFGAEIFLNFVLDVYRPRKPGEFPRPAFESRVLGFVAAPDRIAESIGEAINYQFGYDVSSSWVYRLLGRTVFRVLLPIALVVMWAMSSLAVIRPHERAMVLRFGNLHREIGPGLNFKWPWPVERVQVPEYARRDIKGRVRFVSRTVTGVRTLDIGSIPPEPGKPILWTNEHAASEAYFLVQPGDSTIGSGTSRDLAVLAIEVAVQYMIDDVTAYEQLGPPELRDDLLKSVAQRELMLYASSLSVGEVLSGERLATQAELRRRIEAAFAGLNRDASGKARGAGVKVLQVAMGGAHPPKETAMAFEQVVEASQKYKAKLQHAEGRAIQILTRSVGSMELSRQIVAELARLHDMTTSRQPEAAVTEQRLKVRSLIEKAGGTAAELIGQASADRWVKHMGERARLAASRGQLETYKAAPSVYKAALYLEALRGALKDSRLYITDAANKLQIKVNLEDKDSITDILRTQENPN